jgi:hypothetical protein
MAEAEFITVPGVYIVLRPFSLKDDAVTLVAWNQPILTCDIEAVLFAAKVESYDS